MNINQYNRRIVSLLIKIFSPVKARHSELSLLMSMDDSSSSVTDRLIDISSKVLSYIGSISLNDLAPRSKEAEKYVSVWPGEHYKLLSALTRTVQSRVVVEIGTATGLSALAIKKYLDDDAKIYTFDVIKWQDYPGTCLKEEDFSDGKLVQYVDDLSVVDNIEKYREILSEADLIFMDAEKDGVMEERFLTNFEGIDFKNNPIFILDDIRLWNMLKIWREIRKPKLDITSLGHWSGTGLIDWKV